MKSYSAWLTVWKGLGTLVQTSGSAALIALFAIEWPADASTIDVNGWIVFGFLLLPAAWKVLENWRKNSGYTPAGSTESIPRWVWPWTTWGMFK
jgi:hypothetical protein